jgi:hypothetical protein
VRSSRRGEYALLAQRLAMMLEAVSRGALVEWDAQVIERPAQRLWQSRLLEMRRARIDEVQLPRAARACAARSGTRARVAAADDDHSHARHSRWHESRVLRSNAPHAGHLDFLISFARIPRSPESSPHVALVERPTPVERLSALEREHGAHGHSTSSATISARAATAGNKTRKLEFLLAAGPRVRRR